MAHSMSGLVNRDPLPFTLNVPYMYIQKVFDLVTSVAEELMGAHSAVDNTRRWSSIRHTAFPRCKLTPSKTRSTTRRREDWETRRYLVHLSPCPSWICSVGNAFIRVCGCLSGPLDPGLRVRGISRL